MITEGVAILLSKAFVFLAVIAGGITSLFVQKTSSWKERFVSFFIGCSVSIFTVPYVLHWLFAGNPPKSAEAFCYYLAATCANAALPPFLEFIKERARHPFGGDK